MLRNWRIGVLALLLLGPILLYIALGFLWLKDHRGPIGFRGELILYATLFWILTYALFSYLANRWTRSHQSLLPPLDWQSPGTFTGRDREAWDLVQRHAALGEALPLDALSGFDVYVDSGRSLARELARTYRPDAKDPIEHVPIVDILTALQLAAEDLTHLVREVPAGDLVTPAHWKQAVKAAGYLQRANEIYTVLLPMFQPAAGLVRLGTQKLMVQPAWKGMQQNLMRWFYRAYINRLGTHLIELYSGRLAIGADRYRRMNRGWARTPLDEKDLPTQLTIGIAGIRGSEQASLLRAVDVARVQHLDSVRAHLRESGFDASLAYVLREAQLQAITSLPIRTETEVRSDRVNRRQAVREATQADLVLLLVDAQRDELMTEIDFLSELAEWHTSRPALAPPPVIAVLSGIDNPELPGSWSPPYDWVNGHRARETWVRKRMDQLRTELGTRVVDVVAVGLGSEPPYGVSEQLLPSVAALLPRAERSALLRHLDDQSRRSKVRRVLSQVGRHGRQLWGGRRGTS